MLYASAEFLHMQGDKLGGLNQKENLKPGLFHINSMMMPGEYIAECLYLETPKDIPINGETKFQQAKNENPSYPFEKSEMLDGIIELKYEIKNPYNSEHKIAISFRLPAREFILTTTLVTDIFKKVVDFYHQKFLEQCKLDVTPKKSWRNLMDDFTLLEEEPVSNLKDISTELKVETEDSFFPVISPIKEETVKEKILKSDIYFEIN